MPYKAPSHASWWINRFPWMTPGLRGSGSPTREYLEFRHRSLIVDSHRFLQILKTYWGLELYRDSLNLLEYYGLVIPVRKVGPIPYECDEKITKVKGGKVVESYQPEWLHTERFLPWRKGKDRRLFDLRIPIPKMNVREYRLEYLRPMPWLSRESRAWFYEKGGDIGTPVQPKRNSLYTTNRKLCASGRVWKPTDIEYWALLCDGLAQAPTESDRRKPLELRLRLTAEEASNGNRRCETFYVVGEGYKQGRRGRLSQGLVGYGRSQDAAVASLIGSLRFQTDLDALLRWAESSQATKINSRKKILHDIGEDVRWLHRKVLELPVVRSDFFRMASSFLIFHEMRSRGKSPDDAYRKLGKALKCSTDYARKVVSEGGRLIRLDTV